ncbi:MAG TPA: wax ester/triacylglycerol synthase family O-acyltransferase [Solirubrobacteraceae bacterium]
MPEQISQVRELLTERAARGARSPSQLSATDTSFLLQEDRGAQMHIGGVSLFQGPAPEHEELREHVSERLGLVPRFRQKLANPPIALTRPWWVDDPGFNLDYHLRRTALPAPGDQEQLKALVSRVFSQRLDRGKPLWEMWVVEGLQHDDFALITKVHHALVDGISGVDLASVIMDTAPEPVPVSGAVVPFERHPAPSRAELLLRTAAETAKLPLSFAQYAAGTLLYPQRVSRTLAKIGTAAASTGQELLRPAPSVPLNGHTGPHRNYDFCDVSLEDVRRVRQRYEATINDVVVAAATGALRRWLLARGVHANGLELRALVPVNLRSDQERGLLGNRVALLRAALPVYEEDPEQRLLLVRDEMRELKRSRQLMAAQTIIGLSDFAPPTLLAQASRLNFSTRLFNIIITNVPGPQIPLYLLGRQLEKIAPIAFLPAGHALSIAVFSYNGSITFGLLGDYDRMYDLELVTDGLREALSEWQHAPPGKADVDGPALAAPSDGSRSPTRPPRSG